MTDLAALPELGVGFIYWPLLDGLLGAPGQPVDMVEVEPQPFWFPPERPGGPYRLDQQVFDRLRDVPQPVLVHGVGFPVAGTVPPDEEQLAAFARSVAHVGAPWASEHLSFTRVRRGPTTVDAGFLLPPVQSEEGIAVAAGNIRAIQQRLPVPVAVETGVSYLRPRRGEIPDGLFFRGVAEAADCALLLDLHNVWANERNGRQRVADLVEQLPLERVIEVHLAGGQDYDGYWVDAHSGTVPPELMELAGEVVPRLPNLKAITFEIMPQYVVAQGLSLAELEAQLWQLRGLWERRGTAVTTPPRGYAAAPANGSVTPAGGSATTPGATPGADLPSPAAWESALSDVVTGHRGPGVDLREELGSDPGTAVLRTLISAARAGKIADTLGLTTRLLLLALGEQRTQAVLDEFWDTVPTSQMTADEAIDFVAFVTGGPLTMAVPHLHDVTRFELAAHQAVMTGTAQEVRLGVEPQGLLDALRAGRLPQSLASGDYAVTVSPPR